MKLSREGVGLGQVIVDAASFGGFSGLSVAGLGVGLEGIRVLYKDMNKYMLMFDSVDIKEIVITSLITSASLGISLAAGIGAYKFGRKLVKEDLEYMAGRRHPDYSQPS